MAELGLNKTHVLDLDAEQGTVMENWSVAHSNAQFSQYLMATYYVPGTVLNIRNTRWVN